MGLDLVEIGQRVVVIGGIKKGSNAETPLGGSKLMPGDALIYVEGVSEGGKEENRRSLEGLDFDSTLDVLGKYGDYKVVNLGIKRLIDRNIIVVDVCGPDGVSFAKLQVLSGYSLDMRTLLNANNIKMYDARTYRFDSPYQTGNCGGDGTCGTCLVDVVSGSKLLNKRVQREDAILKQQDCPSSYRWACRTFIGAKPDDEGEVKIRLRPQSKFFS